MIESAIEHALYWDLERMLKKRILNRTLEQEHALCLLGIIPSCQEQKKILFFAS